MEKSVKKLVTVTNKEVINDLRGREDIILLYPLKSFCVGYDLEFNIDEIDDFVLVNRILPNDELKRLESILSHSHIKGIVFDDIGIINLLKDYSFEKILLLQHLACSSISINHYLDYVDSVIISSDITKDEIIYILSNTKKDLVVNVFGLNMLMYSRRTLLTNYSTHHQINPKHLVDAQINDKGFRIYENAYGTVFYAKNYYNALELIGQKNIKYYWYNPVFLTKEQILKVVFQSNLSGISCDTGFLYQKTTYKLKDGE